MGIFVNKEYQRIVLFLGIEVIIIFLLKYVLRFFLPLIVSLAVVIPLQCLCYRKGWLIRRGKGLLAGFIFLLILCSFLLVIGGIATFLLQEIQNVLQNLPYYEAYLVSTIEHTGTWFEHFFGMESGIIQQRLYLLCKECITLLSANGGTLISKSFSYIADIGQFCVFLVVSFICIVLFAKETDRWKQVLLNLAVTAPSIDRLLSAILRIGKKIGSMLSAYFRTQSCILCLICITTIIGLFLAKVPHAFIYGLLAGIFDMLPFIGTGIILVPLAFLQLLQGNILYAIVVIITYILCMVIREFLEPRLMGNRIAISPVGILISIYAGVMFYGIGGVLLGPVTLLISVELSKEIFATKSS